MKTYILIGLMITVITLSSNKIKAQQEDSLLTRKAQITFAYPIGSAGVDSKEYSNKFSFSALYGVNGGLNGGAEIAGIMNINKGDVKGFQLAGITNINEKKSSGLILSGVSNIARDTVKGALISGVLNLSENESNGFQLSTVNIAEKFTGFQLGVFNSAKKLKGMQLGVVNVVEDGNEGVAIGLINIVKNGYKELEFTAGDALYANINYKMGAEKFYTIFKAGYSSYEGDPVYSAGIGFGSIKSLTEKHKMSIDLSINYIAYDFDWDNNWYEDVDILYKADFRYRYALNDKLSLIAGPSFNIYYTEAKIEGEYRALEVPYTMHTNEKANSKSSLWFGFNAGLSIKL